MQHQHCRCDINTTDVRRKLKHVQQLRRLMDAEDEYFPTTSTGLKHAQVRHGLGCCHVSTAAATQEATPLPCTVAYIPAGKAGSPRLCRQGSQRRTPASTCRSIRLQTLSCNVCHGSKGVCFLKDCVWNLLHTADENRHHQDPNIQENALAVPCVPCCLCLAHTHQLLALRGAYLSLVAKALPAWAHQAAPRMHSSW